MLRHGTLAALAVFCLSGSLHAADSHPNILFIFADDQCFETIHATGNEEIQTPNIDSLVSRGTTFSRAYNQGGWHGAVCVASRTMLVTGRYLWNAQSAEKQINEEWVASGKLWPQLFEQAGYRTFFTGKWHVKANPQKTFGTARHVRGGMPAQTPAGYNRPIEGQPDQWKPWDTSFGGFWEGGKHWSEVVGDDACDYLTEATESKSPFFMYIAFNAPHDPRQSPKEYVDRYPLDGIAMPDNFQPEYPFDIGSNRIRDEKLAPFPRTEYSVKVNRQEYYAIITHMDEQIGRILKRLEETGERDNTYIVFTADHGLAAGQHGLMGKQNMHDHSVRVPFIVAGPGIKAGRRIDAPIYLQDVMPTTLDLAGLTVPEYVQFTSRSAALKGADTDGETAVYGAYVDVQRMVTSDDYKLIVYPKVKRIQLYNLAEDPREKNDLSAEPSQSKRISRLLRKLTRLQKNTGDQLDLRKVWPDLFAKAAS